MNNDTLDFLLFYWMFCIESKKEILNLENLFWKWFIPLWLAQKCIVFHRFQFEFRRFPSMPPVVRVHNSLLLYLFIIAFHKSIITVVNTSSVCPGKPICNSNVPPCKPISASFVSTSKPISNRNDLPSKTVSASSFSPIFFSSACANKPISAIMIA